MYNVGISILGQTDESVSTIKRRHLIAHRSKRCGVRWLQRYKTGWVFFFLN